MSEIESGTGEGLLEFLDRTASNGEVHPTTANAFKVAARKILPLAGDADTVDVRSIEVEPLLDRFETRFKEDYTTASMSTYKTRFRQAIALYLAWLDGNPDWTRIVRSRRVTAQANKIQARVSKFVESDSAEAEPTGGQSAFLAQKGMSPRLVKYYLPLRPDLVVQIELPVELTTADAERVAAFVRSLAFGGGSNLTTNTGAESVGE